MSRVPCLVIAFSRLDGIERLLSSINPAEIEVLYVAIDGPTSTEVANTQKQIVRLVNSYCASNSIRLAVWQRDENLGVAVAIITALDWFFAHEDFGIILEDDLIIGEDFIKFALDNRSRLDSDDVFLISGDQFDQNRQLGVGKNWTTYPLIWGWATSKRKWKEMRHGILYAKPRLVRRPFSKVENFWRVGTLRVRSREVDTWDIPLVYFMLQNDKLCLTPNKNLISNLGNDQFASHTESDAFPLNLPTEILDLSDVVTTPRSNEIRAYNSFLEKKVFKVKGKHAFLYVFFLLSLLGRTRNWKTLAQDVSEIEIP
jgi:hypothetical protein